MRVLASFPAIAVLIGGAFAPALHAEERFVSFLFGPGSTETAKQGAHAAAAAAHRWLQSAGSSAELRRAGSPDARSIDSRIGAKELEQVFADTAFEARDSAPLAFLMALDAAAQAAALHPGTRLVVAVLNSPPWSSEAERALDHLRDLCQTNSVHVMVLDIALGVRKEPNAALEALATKTGGMWLRKAKDLDGGLAMVAPVVNGEAVSAEAAAPPVPAPGGAGPAAPVSVAADAQSGIPVHTRFIRTSMKGAVSIGTPASLSTSDDPSSSIMLTERTYESNDSRSPMRGTLMVESPLSALKFEVDDNSGVYQARARVTAIVRNAKGAAVWTGRKELNIHGPARGLNARRQGSLFFMRGVTLPGGERYTLEARVEDLLANAEGTIRTPLQSGMGAPGLMASDALVVRPFSASGDRLEGDEELSYEGQALSPVLQPVFRSEDPIDLQLYFVLYPDVNGPPLELSVEILRDGKVVARKPMQFKRQLRDLGLEGSRSLPGGPPPVVGGHAHEFPYLANIKGAKLPPGNYEAVLSIGQGRNVITRNVAFKVTGSPPAPVEIAGAPHTALLSRTEADDAEVVLPEIEPATVDSSGLAMDPAEQKRLWEEAAKSALGYLSHLPNFRCTQETHRFIAPVKTPGQLKEADSYKDDLMYEDGKEKYRTFEINGIKADASRAEMKGVRSSGEFGTMLHGLFDPDAGASYKWAGRSMEMGVLCQVFDVAVSAPKSNLSLTYRQRRERVGYAGRIFIDEDTGLVRRLTIEGVGLPKDFALQSPAFSLEYGMVRIGSEDFLLPLRSVLQLRELKTFVRNETIFSGYRKFAASSGIDFGK